MLFTTALLLASSTVGVLAVPTSLTSHGDIVRRSVTPNSQGTNNGYFYSMWSDGTGDVQYTNGDAGQYSLSWTNANDVVVGKGFSVGAPRTITYNADYEPNGISFLSIYGWLTDPLTEYYICENYGSGSPAGGDGMVHKGQFESDGSTYDVYEHQQVNAPSIQGVTNFMQYWSIRADKRTSGTINTANHYNYWKSIGLQMGTFGYQILATEGVKSSGKSSVTISEGGSDTGSSAGPASSSPSSSSAAAPVPYSAASSPSAVAATSAAYSAPSSSTSEVAATESPVIASSEAAPTTAATSSTSAAATPAVPSETPVAASALSTVTLYTTKIVSSFASVSTPTPGAGYTPGASPSHRGWSGYHRHGALPTPGFGHYHGSKSSNLVGAANVGGASNAASVDSAASTPTCTGVK